MRVYLTAEVAKIIGVHPNTVRLYEEWNLIPEAQRQANSYRIYTDFHIEQMRLARLAFKIEITQNGLRKKIIDMVKASARKDFNRAILLANEYISLVRRERHNAKEAIEIVLLLLSDSKQNNQLSMKRKEVSEYLSISMDTLRNWELNGLLDVKRLLNGYRIYTDEDIHRLKIIRTLRCANYSLESVLRMLCALSKNPQADIENLLNTPKADDDIISVCDRLIISLNEAQENALKMIFMLEAMKKRF